jgi:hypothetical protein
MRNKKDAQNAGEAVSETPSSRFPLHAGGTEAERFPSRSGMWELPSWVSCSVRCWEIEAERFPSRSGGNLKEGGK